MQEYQRQLLEINQFTGQLAQQTRESERRLFADTERSVSAVLEKMRLVHAAYQLIAPPTFARRNRSQRVDRQRGDPSPARPGPLTAVAAA